MQPIVVLGEHPWAERHLEHVPLEADFVPDAHATRRFEDLGVGVLALYLDDLAHEVYACDGDVADLILRHRTVGLYGHEVTDHALYYAFCCHYV